MIDPALRHKVLANIGVDLDGILGGCMLSAEGALVPSGMGMGRGVPSPAN